MNPFTISRGTRPLLISFPHSSAALPDWLVEQMTSAGRATPDTDWCLPALYNFDCMEMASRQEAAFSRYLIDPNRPADKSNLYPGQPTPKLCPIETFAGENIYLDGNEPDDDEIQKRIQAFWKPYHQNIELELARLVDEFGFAVLFDVHSIKAEVPRLFTGKLPDFNLGTHNGKSCADSLQNQLSQVFQNCQNYSHAVNERFVGGYITRHYGSDKFPNVHAVQLELSQATHWDEARQTICTTRAEQVRPVLESFVQTIFNWIEQQ